MHALLISLAGILGLAVGSFLNVVIYRVPNDVSIVTPRSACPSCTSPITPLDNIPILSWLLLRGRCRTCRAPISARYPIIELVTAALFVGVLLRMGVVWAVPAYLAFFAGLLALACIDLEHMLLPKEIVFVVTALMACLLLLAAARTGHWHDLLVGAISAVSWFVVFFALNAASPRLLGFGDVRLGLLLGLGLGWLGVGYVLLGFFAANLIGAVIGLTLIATHRIDRQQQVPYGVFLALGAAFAVFAGPEVLRPFHHF